MIDDQDASSALVADLQMTIAQLEDKLATKEETHESIKTIVTQNKPQILAVFDGGAFRSGSDIIEDVPFSTIKNLVEEISATPNTRIIIEGHTDNIPTGKLSRDNMDLSLLQSKGYREYIGCSWDISRSDIRNRLLRHSSDKLERHRRGSSKESQSRDKAYA